MTHAFGVFWLVVVMPFVLMDSTTTRCVFHTVAGVEWRTASMFTSPCLSSFATGKGSQHVAADRRGDDASC